MAKKTVKEATKFEKRINDEIIGYNEVRITGNDIESKIVTLKEAKEIALSLNKDLIEINNTQKIPILLIAQYDKYLYECKKNAKNKKQPVQQLKEMQLSANIAINDLKVKANKTREFINDGNKVKVILTLKGRELTRREENKRSILEFIDLLSDISVPESMPKDEGNKTIVILKRKK